MNAGDAIQKVRYLAALIQREMGVGPIEINEAGSVNWGPAPRPVDHQVLMLIESALGLAREVEEERAAHDAIAKLCFAAGAEAGDGTSTSAVKWVCDELAAAISECRKRKGIEQDVSHWKERAEAAEAELARGWTLAGARLPEPAGLGFQHVWFVRWPTGCLCTGFCDPSRPAELQWYDAESHQWGPGWVWREKLPAPSAAGIAAQADPSETQAGAAEYARLLSERNQYHELLMESYRRLRFSGISKASTLIRKLIIALGPAAEAEYQRRLQISEAERSRLI